MAPPEGGQVAGGGGAAPQRQQGGFGTSITGIIRIAVFWYFASKFFSPAAKKSNEPIVHISNLFNKGETLDMWVYLSEYEKFNEFGNKELLTWHETNIPYAVWGSESTRTLSLTYTPSEAVKNSGSVYAHVFFARSGYSPDPTDPEYQPLAAFGRTHPLVKYSPKSKRSKKRSLLGEAGEEGKQEAEETVESQIDTEDTGPTEWISYWKPNVTINLVDDFTRGSFWREIPSYC